MLRASQFMLHVLPMTIRKYEIDIGRGIFKSDGEDDHKRMREAMDDISRLGILTPKSQDPTPSKTSPPGLRLPALCEKFFELRKNLKPATALAYKKSANQFAGFIGNPVLSDIGKSDVTRWQEDLAKFNSVRTIDNKIGVLSSLFEFAKKQGYYFDDNPAIGRQLLSKKDRDSGGWKIFTLDEIKVVFAKEHLDFWRKNDPDYYFCVMVALVSGARISEITSLTSTQVCEFPVPHIKINDSKTAAGVREIPIPRCILDELSAKTLKAGPLFKYKMRLGKGSGNAVSQKFQRHLKAIKVARPKLVFHSIRKFINDYTMKSKMQLEPRCQAFGHEI